MPQKQYGSDRGGQNKGSGNYTGGEKKGGYQGKKPYGQKTEGGYQGKKSYGDKPQSAGYQGKKTYGDKPQGAGYQGNRSYGDKPQGAGYQGNRSYGDKPQGEGYQGKRSYGDKPQGTGYQGNRSYGDKPQGEGYQGKRSFGDKPQSAGYQGKKTYGDKPQGAGYQGKKTYGDKPQGAGYQGNRTYGDKPQGGYKKPFGERSTESKPYEKKPYEKKPYGKRAPYEDRRGEEMNLRDRLLEDDDNSREPDELPFLILGRNAVKEAIKAERSIDRIEVVGDPDGSLREILGLARERKLVIREVDKRHLDEICLPFGHGGKPGNHQGIVAYAAGVEYCTVADILSVAREKGEDPFVVVLDGILDPHNLGSIIRSAECAGAHGVVIGKRRSASVTAATVKASAGATEHVKIARVVNIPAALDELKRAKLWVAGADMAGRPMNKQGLNGPLALVIGGEGDGMSKLTKEKCDFLVAIPQYGKIGSLNAGVAAGVLMFEKKRQDLAE
ncbi:MAG: 23S rRNA (guanosine(2251)-2'-O)-methyltransferase RlmB [Eubacteriales bacterium]|nr:23S rRNA (guanosine(2251)-2'-O)-methyltransferase RlmB [Eubacteriales bacterium]